MDPCGHQPGSEGMAEVVAISLVLGTFAAAPAADDKKLVLLYPGGGQEGG